MTLLTLNVWGLRAPLAPHVEPRMDAIAAALPALDADVVALQEVWTGAAEQRLVSGARRHGYEPAATRSGGSGGLLVLSRMPARLVGFTRYRNRGLPERITQGDYWGGKGFLEVELPTALGPVLLATTHLQARYEGEGASDETLAHRVGQVVELAAALDGRSEPVVALGDFNLREGEPEYRILRGLTGLRDAMAALDRRAATTLASNPYRTAARGGLGHEPDERIDYVFCRDGAGTSLRPVEVRRIFDEELRLGAERGAYSDHAGVFAELALGEDPRHLAHRPSAAAIALARTLLARGRTEASTRRRDERLGAGALLGIAAGSLLAGRRVRRRDFLRRLSHGAALLAGLGAGGLAWLSEKAVRDELGALAEAEALLDALAAGPQEAA